MLHHSTLGDPPSTQHIKIMLKVLTKAGSIHSQESMKGQKKWS